MLFLLFTMASVGLPGTSGFVGEFLALIGAYQANSWVALIATTGIILGAAYMLYLYWRVVYGAARTPEASAMPDLTRREWAILAPVAAVVLWMGVYPESFMAPMRKDVEVLMARIQRAAPAGDAQLAMGAGRPKEAGHGTEGAHGTSESEHKVEPDMHVAPPSGDAEAH
jgi:NADH-quinone oxidoreductase subunit M